MKRILTAIWNFLEVMAEARYEYIKKHNATWY